MLRLKPLIQNVFLFLNFQCTILLLPRRGCELASITRWRFTWGRFNPILNFHLSPSPPEMNFTNSAWEAPCSMQAKPGPKPHLISIAYNTMTGLWSAECAVSPPRIKSARNISWRGCSRTIRRRYTLPVDSKDTTILNAVMVYPWLTNVHNLNPEGVHGSNRPKNLARSEPHQLPSAWSNWDPPFQ